MIKHIISAIRDCMLLVALLGLVQFAVKQNIAFLAEHKQSMIHELDRDFIDQLYTAQRQLHMITEHPLYAVSHAPELANIKERLATIEQQYKKNSPGLALLGPIGTASIVIKEEKLHKQLLALINELSALLVPRINKTESFQPALTVENALAFNKSALKKIIS